MKTNEDDIKKSVEIFKECSEYIFRKILHESHVCDDPDCCLGRFKEMYQNDKKS
jgi:hypothetical protein